MADHTAQIQQQYIAYTGHPVDVASLAYWNTVLDGGASPSVIAQALSATPAYLFAEGGRTQAQFVGDLYVNLFGHAPDAAGSAYWVSQLQTGLPMTSLGASLAATAAGTDLTAMNAKLTVAAAIIAAVDTPAERTAFNGSFVDSLTHDYLASVKDVATMNAATAPGAIDALVLKGTLGIPAQPSTSLAAHATEVEQLYVGFFGRAADPQGLAYWEGVRANGSASLAQVTAVFASSKEYHDAITLGSNRAAIDSLYGRLFGHAADTAGLNYWDNAMTKGLLGFGDIVGALSSSAQGTDRITLDAKISVATAISAHVDTASEIAAYSGTSTNLLVSNYIGAVHDAATLSAALDPAAIDALVAKFSGPVSVLPEAQLVGQAPVVEHFVA